MRKYMVWVTIALSFLLSACGECTQPDNEMPRSFFLENATTRDRMEKLLYVTLHEDGTARLGIPPISSHAWLYPVYYTFADDELLIHYEKGSPIARFGVADNDTLVFIESFAALFADTGARYIFTPQWVAFDGSSISVYADNIPGMEVIKVIGGDVTEWSVTDKAEISKFAEWAGKLVLRSVTFEEGQYPGENDGDIGYLLYTSFGGSLFEFGVYGGDIHYVHIGNGWYQVQNPSNLPLIEA